MSLNTQLSDAAANAAVNALCALANGGFLKIYSGTQPATGNSALTGTLLATINLAATAFGNACERGRGAGWHVGRDYRHHGDGGVLRDPEIRWCDEPDYGFDWDRKLQPEPERTSLVQNALVAVTNYTYTLTEAGS